jgi:hypothetical protein
MQSALGDNFITKKESAYEVNFLPDGFRETVEAEITKRSGYKEDMWSIDDTKKVIDDYFSQLQ